MKFSENANNGDIINAKIAVPLRYLSKFWITLETPLINCKINLILTWSEKGVICEVDRVTAFTITFGISYKTLLPVIILSTQDNTILLQQSKSGFRRTFNWNKYQ